MSFFGELGCKVGIHGWSDWQYKTAGDCTKFKRCTRCPVVSTEVKVQHTPADWKYAVEKGDCTKIRPCSRCLSVLETRVEHLLGDWYYPEEKSCRNIQQCSRCIQFEERTVHPWGPWEYIEPSDCGQVRSCTRCFRSEKGLLHQSWTDWERSRLDPCEELSQCRRCGETKRRRVDHTWDSWHYAGPKTCDQLRFCVRCHKKQERPTRGDDDHAAWSKWDYSNSYSCCMFERHCLRCGAERSNVGLPQHQWTEWKFVSPTRKERRCQRCRHHDWQRISPER
jgi:hypothetical protein